MKKLIKREKIFFEKNRELFLKEYKDNSEYKDIYDLYNSIFLEDDICEISNNDILRIKRIKREGKAYSKILDNIVIKMIKRMNVNSRGLNSTFYIYFLTNLNKIILEIEDIEKNEELIKEDGNKELNMVINRKGMIEEATFIYNGLFIKRKLKIISKNPLVIGLDEDLRRIIDELKEVYIPYNGKIYLVCNIRRRDDRTIRLVDVKKISAEKLDNRKSFRLNPLSRYIVEIRGKGECILNDISKEGLSFKREKDIEIRDGEVLRMRINGLEIEGKVKYLEREGRDRVHRKISGE